MKIPATKAGLAGDRGDDRDAASRINVTLIFSLERYAEVAEAYIRGLERLVEAGGDLHGRSVSRELLRLARVDTEADKRLDAIGGARRSLKGKLGDREREARLPALQGDLRRPALGAARCRRARSRAALLWASTSTKNPDYRDVMYVEELIGPETVNTMPKETIEAFQDHGEVATDARGGRRRGAAAASTSSPRSGSTTTTSTRVLEERGRPEVRRLLRGARSTAFARSAASSSRRDSIETAELVERIWERDPSVWTGSDEAQWLGWLDEPSRMRERVHELDGVRRPASSVDDVRPARDGRLEPGAGGDAAARSAPSASTSSTRPIRRRSGGSRSRIDIGRTPFWPPPSPGTTLETRSHVDYFRERGARFAVITDPGSPLAELFEDVFYGEPTIGGRYSALSVFGILPAIFMGIDVAASARSRGRDARGLSTGRGQPWARAGPRARPVAAGGP